MTPTICKYPNCREPGHMSWKLRPICAEHYELIAAETRKYYRDKKFTVRLHYDKFMAAR